MRRKEENNVPKVLYEHSCQFVTLMCLKNARENSSRGQLRSILPMEKQYGRTGVG